MRKVELITSQAHHRPHQEQACETHDMQTDVQAKKLGDPYQLKVLVDELTAKYDSCKEENECLSHKPDVMPDRVNSLVGL